MFYIFYLLPSNFWSSQFVGSRGENSQYLIKQPIKRWLVQDQLTNHITAYKIESRCACKIVKQNPGNILAQTILPLW